VSLLLLLQRFQPYGLANAVVLAATAVVLGALLLTARRELPVVAARYPDPGHYLASVRRQMVRTIAIVFGVLIGATALAVGLGGGWALLIPPACLLVALWLMVGDSRRLQRSELAGTAPSQPL
jgi:hypothetical protein